MNPPYAHSLDTKDPCHWEPMQDHEARVADRCSRFLTRVNPQLQSWGELLGVWHDVGKYSDEFQKYIFAANNLEHGDLHSDDVSGKVDHSTAAAQLSERKFGKRGLLLAYPFAGHHAGLPDWDNGSSLAGLKHRLKKEICSFEKNTPADLLDREFPMMVAFPELDKSLDQAPRAAFRVQFFIRMLFSGLVDADFLATESFMSPARKDKRVEQGNKICRMFNQLESAAAALQGAAEDTLLNQLRQSIGEQCIARADTPPGIFSLDVPTGGGKTIAGLRFALKHATVNNLDRVIVAIPFTSIVEQNANVYRSIFKQLGENVVIEHHSSLDPAKETTTNRLQAENWDSPLVVTTNVQLFETLFSAKTSRCRKLHRIAKSVIILDEAQALPVELLKPTLFAIRELVEVYGCTIVICTATQPALVYRDNFTIGLRPVIPIIEDAELLHRQLKRVNISYVGKLLDVELSQRLGSVRQVLCIVNTRAHAEKLYSELPEDDGNFHLSTRMCAAHRKMVLDHEIRKRLEAGRPCRVISTQLIEAGVDVDFPQVYRAIAGLDSLAQAAGRCNREGKLECGAVYFFDTEILPPVGHLRQTADTARELVEQYDDLLSPEAIQNYFRLHYWKKSESWDRHKVLASIGDQPDKLQFNFREIADKYRFIREETQGVLIPWGEAAEKLIERLADPNAILDRQFWRRLQQYSVQVRDRELSRLQEANALESMHDRWVLIQPHLYNNKLGLVLSQADGVLPVESTVL